jgi:hypothetical protein
MFLDKTTIIVGIIVAVFVIGWLRDRSFHMGRLAGAREAVQDLSRSCSHHYEREGEPLPESVDKALTYMSDALKRGKGAKGKLFLYLPGAGMLGDAMGESAYGRGIEGGRQWMEPSKGDIRVDMDEREIRTLAWLANIGFHHVIDGGHTSNFQNAADAEAAANAVGTLESHSPPIEGIDEGDSRYDAAWYRQTSIWDKWPNERA